MFEICRGQKKKSNQKQLLGYRIALFSSSFIQQIISKSIYMSSIVLNARDMVGWGMKIPAPMEF
jgi:hypothetical protein